MTGVRGGCRKPHNIRRKTGLDIREPCSISKVTYFCVKGPIFWCKVTLGFGKSVKQLKAHRSVRCLSGDVSVQWQGRFKLGAAKFPCSVSVCSIKHFSLHRKDVGCREFVLVNSTIQIISKNRTKILSAFEQSGSRIQ